ncbi:WYL domain-containing protein [Mesorhizobium sp. GR13]|uniref:WYL domain-containing protein n=1 Tax=Mesorhizobium sp. GR13 TaxID=2562308 RepID=UPI0010C09BE4|nr:WYL domain-containing protein [Mesorhizobium sp. GR13]
MVGTEKADLRWGVERRLEFIEFRLFWEGHVNRGDLMDAFGVSVNQASTDLNRYIGMAPDNMVYDKSARTYIRGSKFDALFLKPDASRYLSQLRSVADGILDRADAWIGQFPTYDAAPTPVRGVNAKTLRSVVAAIRRSEAIEVKYQSLSRPEPRWRWIAPHAIGFDGFRWHTRAFCLTDQSFKDFLLSRIIETRSTKPSEIDADGDADWNEQVTLEIGPHPELSETQQKVIALDYGMRGGRAKIPVRKALVYYALKRLGLDTDPTARRPQDQQIILLNRQAVVGKRNAAGSHQELS